MSKNLTKPVLKRAFLRGSALNALLPVLMAGTVSGIFAAPAMAGSLNTPLSAQIIYQAAFDDLMDTDAHLLDWRSPSVDIYFDVPESDWIDGAELLLSAQPSAKSRTNVSTHMPVMVSLNGAQSVPVYAKGRGFDARITLNKTHMRRSRNKLTIRYHAPAPPNCLSDKTGAWNIDFSRSSVVVKARPKSRDFRIGEFDKRFEMATTAPKSVSITAKGANALTLQMLAAQGVGQRAKTLPDFTLTPGRADVEIIMGRRDELPRSVTDKSILRESGPRAAVHQGRPMRLILTGDTDAQVLYMAQTFAAHALPGTRRNQVSGGEIEMQRSYDNRAALVTKSAKLYTLPGTSIGEEWGTTARIHTFNVADPAVSSGRVLLRLSSNKHVSEDSTVQVKLNGESLGYSPVDRLRKSVAFDIPQGSLNAANNKLEILPALSPKDTSEPCGYLATSPGFSIGEGSRIDLRRNDTSPMTELSRFAATGAPFSTNEGEDTVIVMASSTSQNRAASLKILARLAKASGQSWTQARVAKAGELGADYSDKNVLILGPKTRAVDTLFKAGPKSLNAAISGELLRGGDIYQTASMDTFAAADEAETMRLYAAKQNQNSRILRGGVAALYPSPLSDTRLVGVISTSSGGSFKTAANQLVKDDHWNQLEGSVTRWNSSNVLMAQTAIPEPGAMRTARMRNLEQTPAADFAALLFADMAKEARSVSGAAGDKFAELRARVQDRFSRPLQAERTPPVKTAAKKTTVKAKAKPEIKPQAAPVIKTAPSAVKVADNRALSAPALRGFSKVPDASKSLQDWKFPRLDLRDLRAKMVAHTKDVRAFADAQTAKSKAMIDTLERKTSPMTVLWLGIGLFLFSLIGFIRAGRRKVKYYWEP